jgi:peroxiredoxin
MAPALLILDWLTGSPSATPRVGESAPDFILADQNGKKVRLSDYHGKKNVVLAFYIRAFTPG